MPIIALFNSRMEYGPRALGNRSILFHALDKKTNMYLNKKLNRTETMPFAPIFNLKYAKKLIKNFKQKDLISCENMTMCLEATDLMKKWLLQLFMWTILSGLKYYQKNIIILSIIFWNNTTN